MDPFTAMSLGAAGGALVEAIAVFARINAWQDERQQKRDNGDAELPPLSKFVDLPVLATVALSRILLGALAGLVFHEQLVGAAATIAVGASGPMLLKQLGSFKSVREAVQHGADSRKAVPAPVLVDEAETR
ncbi:hypothetical protein UK23_14615 [Lentzea aerocolonigenes]|uniref:Uncharacterized protein n=1 Tax=Lentzea aerocolonigenes TaxID=68170 RepID=A0A0F0H6Q4_LENAE|nr:hypothetical protein [Lentzea aerocolonigenes]KJK49303.1 hypothetical protein UK23_14615 [Lentzea aerocolonigenes]